MKMVLFRTDASNEIGSGHVMRCLTLAAELKNRGWSCLFLCCELPGNMTKYIERCGHQVRCCANADSPPERLPQAEWLVIDHYGFSQMVEARWRKTARRVMVIDDLANRPHDCDLLLDANYHGERPVAYTGLVPAHCRCLLGPRYALLREEFVLAGQQMKVRDGTINRILIFYGGSDPTQETLKTVNVVEKTGLPFDVVVGASNPLAERIKEYCKNVPEATYHCQIQNMAELMGRADLAFGAGGTATWERCWLGLPTVVTSVADNQQEISEAVAKTGAIVFLGNYRQATQEKLTEVLQTLLREPQFVSSISKAAIALMGGANRQAGTKRVVRVMEGEDVQ